MHLFKMCLFAICGVVLALTGGLRSASAELMYNFQVGTWSAGAYTKQNARQFNHCAASANYNSGILMSFSVSRTFAWSMGFAHPSWRLTQGQTYETRSRWTRCHRCERARLRSAQAWLRSR